MSECKHGIPLYEHCQECSPALDCSAPINCRPPHGPKIRPHGRAPGAIWLIYPDDGGPPVLWTEPCPFPVEDGTVVEYWAASAEDGGD